MTVKRNFSIAIIALLLLSLSAAVSARSPQAYFDLYDGEQKAITAGTQDYTFKAESIFKRQVALALPDSTVENFRIYDEKSYFFTAKHRLTVKLLGITRSREGLAARFYAIDEEAKSEEKPKVSHTIDHDATPPVLDDSIETGETKKYTAGVFEHSIELLYADTNRFVYMLDGVFRVDTTGGKIRFGAPADEVYLRATRIQKLNNGRHRVYFSLFSPDFEVRPQAI